MNIVINISKKLVLIIVLISILISFFATPAAYASKLDLQDGDFYYSGTTKGTYTLTQGIFAWLLSCLGDIVDWLLGLMTLGIRMVIVGWTALIEKLLTWALETTTGLNASGSVVESSTDMAPLSSSSNNITVEAIVYNRVPALSADIFETTYDKTISGTGRILTCECGKKVDECVTITEDEAKAIASQNDITTTVAGLCGSCECHGCDDCVTYVRQLGMEEPLIIQIRETIATWYIIIRLLAVAAMLVVLIGIGIKMAISTVASDKAVYKRMLVDWCGGIVIMFTLHYFMIASVYVTGILVDVVKESANSINQVQMKELSNSDSKFSDSEIEIKVYEEIRSRAYDPKLINGMTGMIMYMTLVYMAVRYTIIYVKRLFTLMVLTLMAPGVGVAYALQKALSGKSRALKTWMTEYINNLVIQVVHAILYAVFISQAMILSLKNISGIILGLMLMNYTMKADKLFKKIFRFGEGDSLAGHTGDAADRLREGIKTGYGMAMGAKPLAKAVANTPYAKAVKGAGKVALAGGVAGAGLVSAGIGKIAEKREAKKDAQYEEDVNQEMDANFGGRNQGENESDEDYATRRQDAENAVNEKLPPIEQLKRSSVASLQGQVDNASAKLQALPPDASQEQVDNYTRYQKIAHPSIPKIAIARGKQILSMENVFSNTTEQYGDRIISSRKKPNFGGNTSAEERTPGKGRTVLAPLGTAQYSGGAVGRYGKKFAKNAFTAAFGTYHWDRENFKFVNEGNSVASQVKNYFGLDDKDKKQLKEFAQLQAKGLGGMASIFVGMGTIVANPKLGLGLIAGGSMGVSAAFGKDISLSNYKGKYSFNRFDPGALMNIKNSAIARAQYERDMLMVNNVKRNHPDLAIGLVGGRVKPTTLVKANIAGIGHFAAPGIGHFAAAGAGIASVPAGLLVGVGAYQGARFISNVAKRSKMRSKFDEIIKSNYDKQTELMEDVQEKAESKSINSIKAQINAIDAKEEEDIYTKALEDAGIIVDKKTGVIIGVVASLKGGTPDAAVKKEELADEIEVTTSNGRTETRKLSAVDAALINAEINKVLQDFANGQGTLDESEATRNAVLAQVTANLTKQNLIQEGQTAVDLFKHKEAGFNKAVTNKMKSINKATIAKSEAERAASEALKVISDDAVRKSEEEKIKNAVTEIVEETGKDITEITTEDILKKVDPDKAKAEERRKQEEARASQKKNKKKGKKNTGGDDEGDTSNPSNPSDTDTSTDTSTETAELKAAREIAVSKFVETIATQYATTPGNTPIQARPTRKVVTTRNGKKTIVDQIDTLERDSDSKKTIELVKTTARQEAKTKLKEKKQKVLEAYLGGDYFEEDSSTGSGTEKVLKYRKKEDNPNNTDDVIQNLLNGSQRLSAEPITLSAEDTPYARKMLKAMQMSDRINADAYDTMLPSRRRTNKKMLRNREEQSSLMIDLARLEQEAIANHGDKTKVSNVDLSITAKKQNQPEKSIEDSQKAVLIKLAEAQNNIRKNCVFDVKSFIENSMKEV